MEDAAASFLRLQKELFEPLINRCLYILKKKGLFPPIVIDNKLIELKFQTPLSLGKGQIDVNQFMLWWQNSVNVLGPQLALASIDFAKVPYWMAENMNVYLGFVKNADEMKAAIEELKQAAQQAANDQQLLQGGLNAGTTEPSGVAA